MKIKLVVVVDRLRNLEGYDLNEQKLELANRT